MSYKKALFGFPLITFLIAFVLFYFFSAEPIGEAENIGLTPNTGAYLINCAKDALWFGAIPALIISLWATRFNYFRHQLASIVLITAIVAFVYFHLFNVVFYAIVRGESYLQHLLNGGIEISLLFTLAGALYSIFVLPFLLPKRL